MPTTRVSGFSQILCSLSWNSFRIPLDLKRKSGSFSVHVGKLAEKGGWRPPLRFRAWMTRWVGAVAVEQRSRTVFVIDWESSGEEVYVRSFIHKGQTKTVSLSRIGGVTSSFLQGAKGTYISQTWVSSLGMSGYLWILRVLRKWKDLFLIHEWKWKIRD